jgi:hypothetical protein
VRSEDPTALVHAMSRHPVRARRQP